MSLVSELFFSDRADANTLHRRITPSVEQEENQTHRWHHLAEHLIARLPAMSGYGVSTWLQGSYKFGTQIRPSGPKEKFDIDLGVYFKWAGEDEDGKYEPHQLKGLVQSALIEYQTNRDNDATHVDDPKERCNRIGFAPDFHIDVPSYHLDKDRDHRSLATETLGWEHSDPKAIYQWFKGLFRVDAQQARLRRTVRYFKMWSCLKMSGDTRPSSIMITVLVAEAMKSLNLEALDGDDAVVWDVASVIAERMARNSEVRNPVDREEDLNRIGKEATRQFIGRLHDLCDVGRRAAKSRNLYEAAEIWAESFEHFFPMPEDSGIPATSARDAAVAVFSFNPDVLVTAVPKSNDKVKFQGVNSIKQLPKDCDISFTILEPEKLPNGATVKWTVRNTGQEAAEENDLGHIAGDGISVTRHTAYNGSHAMDLVVYLGNQLIGRRRINVSIQGAPVPSRNPPRRRYPR